MENSSIMLQTYSSYRIKLESSFRVAVCCSRKIWLNILVLPLTRNMTLAIYLNSWNPSFCLNKKGNNRQFEGLLWKLNKIMFVEHLLWCLAQNGTDPPYKVPFPLMECFPFVVMAGRSIRIFTTLKTLKLFSKYDPSCFIQNQKGLLWAW